MKTHTNLEGIVGSNPSRWDRAKKGVRNTLLTLLVGATAACVPTQARPIIDGTPTAKTQAYTQTSTGTTTSESGTPTGEATYLPTGTGTLEATVEPTATYTLTPTATTAPLGGRLFFDMNGSGLADEASFNYDADRLTDERQPLQADLLAAITAYINEHPELQDGDLITLEEPGLSNYTVCAKDICSTTGADGSFVLPGATQNSYLNITDPNAGTPALEMRYINKWNKAVTVPAYTKDVDANTMATLKIVPGCDADADALVCKLDGDTLQVRDQHLNDTSTLPLSKTVQVGQNGEIGLMQGYVIMPLTSSDFSKLDMIQGFDQDPSIKTFDYTGSTLTCSEYNICQRMDRIPGVFLNATGNDHTGIDLGYYGSPAKYNMLILAGMGGYSQVRPTNGGKLKNNLDILSFIGQNFGGSSKPLMNNGHLLMYLIEGGIYVYPGQIIGIMGNTGTAIDWTHLHFEIQYGTPINNDWIGQSKDFFRQINANLVVQNFNDKSVWTVDNIPIYFR